MPLEREHDTRILVYVVESPSHEDFYSGRSEGALIAHAAALNQIPCTVRAVTSEGVFSKALTDGLYALLLTYPDHAVMLHISAHGTPKGIALTDGSFLTWESLRSYLKPINKALSGNLFLCMSSCGGGSAVQMSMHPGEEDFPYAMMVGNYGTPTWAETAVGYATLYHHIASGRAVPNAVEAMKVASGNDNFFCKTAKELYDGFLDYMKNEAARTRAIHALAAMVDQGRPGMSDEIKSSVDQSFGSRA